MSSKRVVDAVGIRGGGGAAAQRGDFSCRGDYAAAAAVRSDAPVESALMPAVFADMGSVLYTLVVDSGAVAVGRKANGLSPGGEPVQGMETVSGALVRVLDYVRNKSRRGRALELKCATMGKVRCASQTYSPLTLVSYLATRWNA